MTHFTVLVRVDGNVPFDGIDEAVANTLAPYDENIQVAPYRSYANPSTIGWYIRSATTEFTHEGRVYRPTLDKREPGMKRPTSPANRRQDYAPEGEPITGEALERWNRDWDEYKRLDREYDKAFMALYTPEEVADAYNRYWGQHDSGEKGIHVDEQGIYEMSTYNPQSRWDWWTIGGRWRGFFTVRDRGEYPMTPGNPGTGEGWEVLEEGESFFSHMDKVESVVRANTIDKILRKQTDICRVMDIDWEGMAENQRREFAQHYDECAAATGHARELSWHTRQTPDDISKEDYVEQQMAGTAWWTTTTAICDPELGWVENGRTGWFGATGIDGEMTEAEWSAKWNEYVKGLDPNDWVVLVDCHI